MTDIFAFYVLVAAMWFFQEWKDTRNVTASLISGVFWIFEIFEKVSKPKKP